MKTNHLLIIILLLGIAFQGCRHVVPENDIDFDEPVTSMTELNVPADFDWKTHQTVDISISVPSKSTDKPILITNRDASRRYFKGYSNSKTSNLTTKITIPAYLHELRIIQDGSPGPNMVTIDNGMLTFDFNTKNNKMVADNNCDLSGFITYSKGGWGSNTHGNNVGVLRDTHFDDVYPGDFVIGDLNNHTITFTSSSAVRVYLPGGGAAVILNHSWTDPSQWIALGNMADQIIAARLNVDFNAAGFLGTNPDYTLGELVFVSGPFQNMSVNDFLAMAEIGLGGGGLNGFTPSQYATAAENINNSFEEGNNNNLLTCPPDPGNNTHPDIELSAVCATPDGIFTIANVGDDNMDNALDYYVYLNNVLINTGTYQLDINDTQEIVVAYANENDVARIAVDTPADDPDDAGATIEIELADCGQNNGGGTTEEFDGTLAYEDLWPGTGDYDFNDLVIDYEFNITKDNQEYVETVSVVFTINAFGASYHNGFGFSFPNVAPSAITDVSGYDIANTDVFSMAANGTENGQSKATFIVFDDVRRIMPQTTPGIGVNTQLAYAYIAPVTISLDITFANNTVTYSQLDIGSFNPFLIVNTIHEGIPGERGLEIHLPNYAPTDLFDQGYFGQFEDDSDPGADRYFVTTNNLPWGINIAEPFDWVIEFQDIIGAYYHFAEWAESGGTNYPDWFQDNTGYRNDNLIYPTQQNP
jgi:LruC domain-containing protein